MLKMHQVWNREDIPNNWRERLVVLWSEDDARPADRERGAGALSRITGMNNNQLERRMVHRADDGDVFYTFYQGGWVHVLTCEGAQVGVLVAGAFN